MAAPVKDRFGSKYAESDDGCWHWLAAKDPKGYGRFRVGDRMEQAHRVSYELFVGAIPDGMIVDHRCFNPSCVNPDHLRVLSRSANTARENLKTWGAETCAKGIHPKPAGWAGLCRECRKVSNQSYRDANRDEVNRQWRDGYYRRTRSAS